MLPANQSSPAGAAPPEHDLRCPLCGYSLRGLARPQCPECGFEFTWDELVHAEQSKHPYLFEHGRGRNGVTFFKTYFATCRPRRFWTDVKPSHPVRLGRLAVYWVLTFAILLLPFVGRFVQAAYVVNSRSMAARSIYEPVPGNPDYVRVKPSQNQGTRFDRYPAELLDRAYPRPWMSDFWTMTWDRSGRGGWFDWSSTRATVWIDLFVIAALWPGVTLGTLVIFRVSMKRSRIRTGQLARTAFYSADVGVLMVCVAGALAYLDPPWSIGMLLLVATAVLAIAVGHRLAVAFDRYLHLHRPAATAVAAQVVAWLVTAVALVFVVDFGARS